MTVLARRIEWSKPRKGHSSDLTKDEQKHVRKVVTFMRTRLGSWQALATRSGVEVHTLKYAASARGTATPGVAIRVARAAGVPVERILDGSWPLPGMCPHCGRE
jgi:hypothetical protein